MKAASNRWRKTQERMRTENENSFENSREEKLLKLYEKNKISENLRQTINEKKLYNLNENSIRSFQSPSRGIRKIQS